MKRLLVALCVAVAVSGVAFGQATQKKAPAAQEPDPLIGTWELNLAKSTFGGGTKPPRSSTRTYEALPNGYKYVNKGVDAVGKPVLAEYTAYYDGKDHPMIGNPETDTISITRIDKFTGESIQKKGGKVVYRNRRVISSDGKVMTLTSEGNDAQGKPFTNVLVLDRK
jgi:hypothetical protein